MNEPNIILFFQSVRRCFNSHSATPERTLEERNKMAAGSQVRSLTANQWKVFVQLKDFILKAASDRRVLLALTREWDRVLHQLPTVKAESKTETTPQPSVTPSPTPEVEKQETRLPAEVKLRDLEVKDSNSYWLPQYLTELKFFSSKQSSEDKTQENNGKSKKETISKVSTPTFYFIILDFFSVVTVFASLLTKISLLSFVWLCW